MVSLFDGLFNRCTADAAASLSGSGVLAGGFLCNRPGSRLVCRLFEGLGLAEAAVQADMLAQTRPGTGRLLDGRPAAPAMVRPRDGFFLYFPTGLAIAPAKACLCAGRGADGIPGTPGMPVHIRCRCWIDDGHHPVIGASCGCG